MCKFLRLTKIFILYFIMNMSPHVVAQANISTVDVDDIIYKLASMHILTEGEGGVTVQTPENYSRTSITQGRVQPLKKNLPIPYFRTDYADSSWSICALATDGSNFYQLRSRDLSSESAWTGTSNGADGQLYLDLRVVGQNYNFTSSVNMGLRIALTKSEGDTVQDITIGSAIDGFISNCNVGAGKTLGIVTEEGNLFKGIQHGWRATATWYTSGFTDLTGGSGYAPTNPARITLLPTSATIEFLATNSESGRQELFSASVILDPYVSGMTTAINFSNRTGEEITITPAFSADLDQAPAEQIVNVINSLDSLEPGEDLIVGVTNTLNTAVNAAIISSVPAFLNDMLLKAQTSTLVSEEFIPHLPNCFDEQYYFGAVGGPVGAKNFIISSIENAENILNLIGVWDDAKSTEAIFNCDLASNFNTGGGETRDYVDAAHDFAPAANVSDSSAYFPTVDGAIETMSYYPHDDSPAAAVFRFLTEDKQAAILLYAPRGISLGGSNTTASGADSCADSVAQTLSTAILSGHEEGVSIKVASLQYLAKRLQ